MINLNLENAVAPSKLERYKEKVNTIATEMDKYAVTGFEYLGWKDLPKTYDKAEIETIKRHVRDLVKQGIDTLVVIGIGGSFAGAKAGIEMVLGEYPSYEDSKMEIIWVGESVSSTNLAQKLKYVEDRNFAINVISKSGTTIEPAIAFRMFRKLLEEQKGVYNASRLIFATTDAKNGLLLKMAKTSGYTTFVIPNNIGGRFSVLTPVGLFPMACAGLNISNIMDGAYEGWKEYSTTNLLENDAYKYAVARDILSHKFPVELMVQYEPQMRAFNEWWKQLSGESEGKNGKGIFPASAVFSTDLHSLGQFIQEGSKILFETVITFKTPSFDVSIMEDKQNIDELNYVADTTVHEINQIVFNATTEAHVRVGKVPSISIQVERMNEFAFGKLVTFFMRAVAMTAYLLGVNPFNQPGVEVYKQNMQALLKKIKTDSEK